MKCKILSCLLFLGITGLAQADHCQQVQQVVQTIAVQPVAVQAVVVPAYFATYAPQSISAAAQNLVEADRLTEMEKRLERIEQMLLQMQQGHQQPMTETVGGLDVMRIKCASCHKVPAEKGLGFTLFDGQNNLVPLNPKDKQRVFNRVSRNSMPPPESGIKLTEADKKAIISLVK